MSLRDATRTLKAGDYATAHDTLSALIKADPTPEALLLRASANALTKDFDGMSDDLLDFFQLQPDWIKTDPLMSGWLKKYPDIGKAKTRYFYVKQRVMAYYRAAHDPQPIAAMVLHDFTDNDKSYSSALKFNVNLPDRKFVLEAESESDRTEWNNVWDAVRASSVVLTCQTDQVDSTAASLSSAKVEGEEGDWLYKRGVKNPAWKHRWCVLRATILYYFENETAAKPKGTMDLKNCKVLKVADKGAAGKPEKFKFIIRPPIRREMFLYADTEEVRTKWIKKIQVAAATVKLNEASVLPVASDEVVPPEVASQKVSRRKRFDRKKTGSRANVPGSSGHEDTEVKFGITEEAISLSAGPNGTTVQEGQDPRILYKLESPTPPTSAKLSGGSGYGFEIEEKKRDRDATSRGKSAASSFGGGADSEEEEGTDFLEGTGEEEQCTIQ